jgi:(2R)-3-sulfolactate dehydrogenase (NADP+)
MKVAEQELASLVQRALRRAGANDEMASATARALVMAEAQGLASHGLSRVAQYATHLRNGRVNGEAVPRVARRRGAALLVDADEGLAFGALALAVEQAVSVAREQGVAFAGVVRSHHAGVLADSVRPIAARRR